MKTTYVCGTCGSKKVQSKAWVNLNEEVMSDVDYIGTDDISNNWCEDCQDYVLIEEESKYLSDLDWIQKQKR